MPGPVSFHACWQHDVAAAITCAFVVPGSGSHRASHVVQDVAAQEHQASARAGSEATNANEQSIMANTKRRFLSIVSLLREADIKQMRLRASRLKGNMGKIRPVERGVNG